ncbi:AzlC family ABC transporter permease [Ruegeria pomeroyi]|uniref:AzlC family protein n=2 Tax=Ruegeria pomeroyi TaxID=89184 RepID=Q5LX93_RUEPO|nr:AzlC family ABC transporter permease [Ruegeria pomeroyi]HCE71099.1 branched-chain amino acid transporter AzlC [Ruegeria sp.]AAV93623.1 AzlC family protein [Ruegeria pomeroyi DSS-3]NVK99370.1 AzlC family ABC transporter permease [Ruegeria pomeroyi]NVL01268.1 AzlC family ABC transporter permease [Ruegeria pomeroyi]QWV07213.1 AzlC family ABC transporter permease [Ruegeria pomeroyi]
MSFTTSKSVYWKGFRDGAPFIMVAAPFGTLFGVFATEAGLNLVQVMTFTATVFAGAAQFTALQLLLDDTPTLIVLLSALAVNLRVAMYSAALTPYLGAAPLWQRAVAAYFTVDQSYALSVVRFETEPDLTVPQRMAYFFGTVTPLAPAWYLATYLGAVLGTRIPDSWALDFALPITFLAMIGPMLRTLPHVIAALVAIVTALLTAAVPFNLGLLIAGTAGMMAGARAEVILERRSKRT